MSLGGKVGKYTGGCYCSRQQGNHWVAAFLLWEQQQVGRWEEKRSRGWGRGTGEGRGCR